MILEKYVFVEDLFFIEGKISLNFFEKYFLKMNDIFWLFEKKVAWNFRSYFKFVLGID